jgi:hypothetical protein
MPMVKVPPARTGEVASKLANVTAAKIKVPNFTMKLPIFEKKGVDRAATARR